MASKSFRGKLPKQCFYRRVILWGFEILGINLPLRNAHWTIETWKFNRFYLIPIYQISSNWNYIELNRYYKQKFFRILLGLVQFIWIYIKNSTYTPWAIFCFNQNHKTEVGLLWTLWKCVSVLDCGNMKLIYLATL